ncbi:MAG: hypothetical protein ACRDLN_09185 [Solirubrobacteraceae bacterium]
MTGDKRYAWGQAYRDGSLICESVRVTLARDDQPGAAPRQCRRVLVRFDGGLHPTMRAELTELASCQGAAAHRVAERIEPIVLLLGDPRHGRERIVGRLLPPQTHRNDLREVQFRVRELRP